jgi:hypothetical protein
MSVGEGQGGKVSELDLDELCDDISHSMSADDRQTRAEYERGCHALHALRCEIEDLRARIAALSPGAPRSHREPG